MAGESDFSAAQNARLVAALRTWKAELDLTNEEAGKTFGVSGPAISQWLGGKNRMRWRHARTLATLLGRPLEELAGPSDEPSRRAPTDDRIHPSIAKVAHALGYSDAVAQSASDGIRSLHGPDAVNEETAVQLLADADLYLRKMARTIGADLRVAEPISDDLPGGGAAEAKSRSKRTK